MIKGTSPVYVYVGPRLIISGHITVARGVASLMRDGRDYASPTMARWGKW